MNSPSNNHSTEPREFGSPNTISNGINKNGYLVSIHGAVEAKHRLLLVQWLTTLLPSLYFPINITDDDLRTCLSNGTVLCQILNKLRPGFVNVVNEDGHTLPSQSENVKTFLKALDGLGLPQFEISDLEKGSMKAVVDCLLTLRAKSLQNAFGDNISGTNSNIASPRGNAPSNFLFSPPSGDDQSKFQRVLSSPVMQVSSASLIHQVGHKFHEVFQLKPGSYADLSPAKISEMMKSNSLDNAPTQSLLSVVNGILEESVERRNGEIPHRVACLLRKVTQEIERRMSSQAEHLRTQNNLFKAREEKYQSRIRVLEALASGTREETEIIVRQLRQWKAEKIKEEENMADEKDVTRLMKEQEDKNMEISALNQELETTKNTYEVECMQLKEEAKSAETELKHKSEEYEHRLEELRNKVKELEVSSDSKYQKLNTEENQLQEDKNMEISALNQELETTKKTYEVQCSQLESEAKGAEVELRQKSQEYEHRLEELRNKVKELEASSDSKNQKWNMEILTLNQELESTKKAYEAQCSQLEAQAKDAETELRQKSQEYEHRLEELRNKVKELEASSDSKNQKWNMEKNQLQDDKNMEISTLKQELETTKKAYEAQCSQLEAEAKDAEAELRQKSQEYEHRSEELRNKVKELEASSASIYQKWNMEKNQLKTTINFQFSSLQKLKLSWESIKHDVMTKQTVYAEECNRLGVNLKSLVQAAENYQEVLAENQKLFNELQELKGNIRVYCRIRPFLSGKNEKQSIVEHIGENDLVVANPTKEGKDALKSFKFNKVFGPASSQVEVYSDIQSLIRSVLDGYNVCIFAYGQTGSGKTYTMTGPNGATSENLGVNYRALNDLFKISTSRASTIIYEIGVQMVEIYNEQVRDLLSTEGSAKRLGILTQTQSKGIAVPDASMYPVKSPSDVIKLMDIGLKNRAMGATAMNERSSRSHSVVSIHVRGKELKSGSILLGNLHLVDLAGSERVDRSEVTGDRLKEAQHINKSLSALGDVIFALSQKSSHVPYRNSKLTQLLQTSLGGQAKTLMFVQINSDVSSFSETLSTLKFAERVSGVELGAARSSKEGRDIRELMEQVAQMRNSMLKKDEEIERLQLLKGSVGGTLKDNHKPLGGGHKHLEADTKQPMDDHIHHNEFLHQSEISGGDIGNIASNAETLGFSDAEFEERLSDNSDNGLAPGTETDASSENSIHIEGSKSSDKMEKSKTIPKNVQAIRKLGRNSSSITSTVKDSPLKKSPGIKKSASIGHQLKASKRWQ